VRQLLALAKLEAKSGPAPNEITNAGEVLREVVASCAAPAGLVIEINAALDQLNVKGDRESLHLIFRNLHENAVAHCPAPAQISWSALADKNGLMVLDDGPGIPDEELPLVTKRFYRGRTRSGSGTGLGLTIAELAAARIGACLSLANRSDRPGLLCRLIWA
jgi:two-component system sensor histidine kinase QseC